MEYGLEPAVFEASDDIGGIWRYTDFPNSASVMKSTIINKLTEMTDYRDFPPQAEFPNYRHHSKLLEYLLFYTEEHREHRLLRFICLRTLVTRIERASDYPSEREVFDCC
ncbi:dimethylaniline monooxygenase [Aphelenchoides avenae]|nr:dimethylaniline monooxygenase [Aphelenchus avenae]